MVSAGHKNYIAVKKRGGETFINPISQRMADYSYGLSNVPSYVAKNIVQKEFGDDWKSIAVWINGIAVCGTERP